MMDLYPGTSLLRIWSFFVYLGQPHLVYLRLFLQLSRKGNCRKSSHFRYVLLLEYSLECTAHLYYVYVLT
ncbi:hypothetical protein QE152_g39010 [Popillia japonica]|uniref:Uncharacterized protein n=1 Tax=Popillia japonica TaxID=7064 RepID=A0AAW1HVB3_POPJA